MTLRKHDVKTIPCLSLGHPRQGSAGERSVPAYQVIYERAQAEASESERQHSGQKDAFHQAYRKSLARQGKGPHLSIAVLAEYIAAEQELGRIDSGVDAKLAANLLMSSSFFRAFMEKFSGKTTQPSWDHYAKKLVAAVAPQPARNATN